MSDPAIQPKKLVLVDAYSLLFRAYFGGRYLSTADGRPTGALFGFSNMLFSILSVEKPDSMVVCWDAHEQTQRSKDFEAYKAHRPDTDQQLIDQMPGARTLVEAMGIASSEIGGYEADDLIGTLAVKGAAAGYDVYVFTGDSDQLQLVGDNITILMTQRGVTDTKKYDREAVIARYGIPPERIPDWKALVGDTSDNIPGVPGIGDKTATALLQKWDSLENLLEHVSEVTPPKAKNSLEAHLEQAKFAKKLATIICDAPAELPDAHYEPTKETWEATKNLFLDLEFKSLLTRIPQPKLTGEAFAAQALGAQTTSFAPEIVFIQSEEELQAALKTTADAGTVALRPRLDSEAPMKATLKGIAFAPSAETAYYVEIEEVKTPGASSATGGLFEAETEDSPRFTVPLSSLESLFCDEKIVKWGHDIKRLEIVLENEGFSLPSFDFDTLIGAYLLNAGRTTYALTEMAETHLNFHLEPREKGAPEELLAAEAALVFALSAPMKAALEALEMTKVLTEVDMPLVPVLADIERAGIMLDVPYISALATRMGSEIAVLAKDIYALAGEEFNIGSPKQLQVILFEKLQLPTGKKTKTGFSTGADLLESLAPKYEICQKVIDYRELAKLKATYADSLPKLVNPRTGRVHTSLNQTIASSGRLSSTDPNLQNIPVRSEVGREIRRAFIAPKGKIMLSCDYSQIELRILASMSKDPAMMEAFKNDEDVHVATAAIVFGVPLEEVTSNQRRQAKTINFAVIYGQSAFSLAAILGVEPGIASQWIKDYFARLPGVKDFIDSTIALAHQQKYVSTLLGRRRYMTELESGNHNIRQHAERAAVNMPIQGTAADIMKLAMIRVKAISSITTKATARFCFKCTTNFSSNCRKRLLPDATPKIVECMETAFPMDVHSQGGRKIRNELGGYEEPEVACVIDQNL